MGDFLFVIAVVLACVLVAVGVVISVVFFFAQLGWYLICWNFGLMVMAVCWEFVKHLFKTLGEPCSWEKEKAAEEAADMARRIAQRAEMEERLLAAKNARDEVAAEREKAQKFEDTIRAKAGLPTYRLPKSH
jgi:hypothetical protein